MSTVRIISFSPFDKKDLKKYLSTFIDVPLMIYSNYSQYVHDLVIAMKDKLSGKYPFFKHSKCIYFIALRNDKPVGRIAAIVNNNHRDFTGEEEGFFGFFDCIDDEDVALSLFNNVINYLRGEGLRKVIGPTNFSTNETCGCLIKGFEYPPVVMMPWNPSYIPSLIEKAGFTKKVDLLSYYLSALNVNYRLVSLYDNLRERLKRLGIVIRTINFKNFDAEVEKLLEVYNQAWCENTNFVPMTEEEFKYTARDLKQIALPDLAILAEKDNKVIGFSVAIPDINIILRRIQNGRLFPTGIFKLIFGLKKIKFYRIITLGVLKEFRNKGVDVCLYGETFFNALRHGIYEGEASWILEDNTQMRSIIENVGGVVYKVHRLYQRLI